MSRDTAIVLTGAIIVSPGSTAVEDAELRRQQYLAAVRFYVQFAPVYFLENSGYDLLADADFASVPGLHLRPVSAQENERRGKGYLEFHALDLWYDSETHPPARILKITGRYRIANIVDILKECRCAAPGDLLVDRYKHDRLALTRVFSASWQGYDRYLRGLYRQADDPAGAWIERVLYRALLDRGARCLSFRHEPDMDGIDGSSGSSARAGRFKYFLQQAVRTLNRLFDRQFLYLRGTSLSAAKQLLRSPT